MPDARYRSRFEGRIVDAHCHVDAPAREHFPRLLAGARVAGVLNLWDATWPPPPFARWQESMRAFEPQMQLCHMPDLSDVGADGFERALADGIRAAAAAGAAGLKVWKNLGLWLEDLDGRRLALTDARVRPLWETAAETGLPIVIHVGDPPDFFAPLDASNRRRAELELHPDWWYGRGGFPTLEELHDQFEQVIAGNPGTTFVAAHFGCFFTPRRLRELMDRYANFNVDTSVQLLVLCGEREQARACRELIVDHPDRVLFGTDFARTDFWDLPSAEPFGGDRGDLDALFSEHWRFFETAERISVPYPFTMEGDELIGIDLPDDVLEQVYAGNARRLFRGGWELP